MKAAPYQVELIINGSKLNFSKVTLVFEEVTGRPVLLLPMGSCDDGAHSQNEKLNLVNYMEGTKVMAQYIHQLGQL